MRSFYHPAEIRQYDYKYHTVRFKLYLNFYYLPFLQVGYYDPFVNARRLGFTDTNEWGAFGYLPVDQFNFDETWLLQKEYRMNQFPLIFSVTSRFPSLIRAYPQTFKYTGAIEKAAKKLHLFGTDGLILGHLAEVLDFNAVLITPRDLDNEIKNGTLTGAIGDILYGHADVAFNSRIFSKYNTTGVEYLLSLLDDKVCVVAPAATKISQWLAVLRYFDNYFWFALLITIMVTSSIYFWINYYDETSVRYDDKFVFRRFPIRIAYMKIVQVIIGMTTHLPFTHKQRLVIGACLLANRIISGHFEVNAFQI